MNQLTTAIRGGGPALFAPIVYRLAARLEQVEPDEMLTDAATAAFVLRSAQQLFGTPLVVNHYQLGLELDAPLLDTAIDVAGRLSAELRDQAMVLGVLTGPSTLAGLRGGSRDGLTALYAGAARRYAELNVAGILVAEDTGISVDDDPSTLAELTNICRFYGIGSVLLAPSGQAVSGTQVDLSLGVDDAIPVSVLGEDPGSAASEWRDRTGLLLTAGEVPADVDPAQLTAWVDEFGSTQIGMRT